MTPDEVRIGFLTYLSRSGSTLLSRLLNEYRDICVTTEASLPAELFGIKGYKIPQFDSKKETFQYLRNISKFSKLGTWPIELKNVLKNLPNSEFPIDGKDLFKAILLTYRSVIKPNANLILFKGSPIMPWFVPELMQIFPDSIILHIYRDPRALYASQKNNIQPYTDKPFASSPTEIGYDWKRAVRAIKNIPDKNVIEVKYESLVIDNENTIEIILDTLGVNKDKATENTYSDLIPEKEKVIHKKVGENPDQNRTDAWKKEIERDEIELLEYYLTEELIEYDYDLISNNKTLGIALVSLKELIFVIMRRKLARIKRISSYLIKEPGYFFNKLKLWR